MDSSKPYVRLSAAQGTPVPAEPSNPPPQKPALSSSSSLSGSLSIRAPPTPDSDSDSQFQELGYSSSGSISSSGSDSEAFVTGEEFETASERPLVADPDEEFLGPVERYELSWPFVADPDDGFDPVVEKVMVDDAKISGRVMPIAQLSWESDDDGVVGSDGVLSEVEEVEFSGRVKVLGNGVVEKLSVAPRVKVFEVEEGGEDEDELVKCKESLVVEQSEAVVKVKGFEGGEGSDLNNFFEAKNEWLEDNGVSAAAADAEIEDDGRNSTELSISVSGGEKAKYVAEESFVHCPNSERSNGVDLGVEGIENQSVDSTTYSQPILVHETLCLENCDLSELTKDDEFENALCSDLLKSITLSSLSVPLLCENGEENVGAVQFQGDTAAYGAKVEVPFKEKEFPLEKEQIGFGLLGEKIIITPGVSVLEGEESGPVLSKESLIIEQSEPACELKCVEGSELYNFVSGQKRKSIQAERIEDNGLAAAEINKALERGQEKGKCVADELVVHCPNSKRSGVDSSGSSEAPERGKHSGTDFGVEGNEDQIRDSTTYSEPNPVQEIVCLGNGDLSEATECDRFEYALCRDFLKLITPSSSATRNHIFRDETEVESFNINGTAAEVTVTLSDENMVTGLKVEDQMAIGEQLVLAGSAGALQFEGDTAHGAKLEVRLNDKDFPRRQDPTSLGLSLMKWGGGLVLTADILSLFSVRNSEMAVHVVLDNKQRGKIAIKTSSSNQLQVALVGILSVAASIFGIFRPRFGVKSSR